MSDDDFEERLKKAKEVVEEWGEGPRIGLGFTDPGNPVECDNCKLTVIAEAEEFEDQFQATVFKLTHKCPNCLARGIIITTDGIPVLRHPRFI